MKHKLKRLGFGIAAAFLLFAAGFSAAITFGLLPCEICSATTTTTTVVTVNGVSSARTSVAAFPVWLYWFGSVAFSLFAVGAVSGIFWPTLEAEYK